MSNLAYPAARVKPQTRDDVRDAIERAENVLIDWEIKVDECRADLDRAIDEPAHAACRAALAEAIERRTWAALQYAALAVDVAAAMVTRG
jgi:hypothetical protein